MRSQAAFAIFIEYLLAQVVINSAAYWDYFLVVVMPFKSANRYFAVVH